MTPIEGAPSTNLDSCPNPIPIENKAVMVFHFENKESRRTGKDAVDVGSLSTTADWEIVVGGMFIAQSQRAKMGPERLFTPDSALVSSVDGTAGDHDEKGDYEGDEA